MTATATTSAPSIFANVFNTVVASAKLNMTSVATKLFGAFASGATGTALIFKVTATILAGTAFNDYALPLLTAIGAIVGALALLESTINRIKITNANTDLLSQIILTAESWDNGLIAAFGGKPIDFTDENSAGAATPAAK